MICQGGCFFVPRGKQQDSETRDKLLTPTRCHSGNYYYIKNVCERTVKIFFTQYRDLSEGGEGNEAREQVNERERTSRRADISGRSTPPIVLRGKTRSKQARGKEKAPKAGPPKRRKKK